MLILTALLLNQALTWALRANVGRSQQAIIPKYPYDESTTKYCAWWLDNDGAWTCGRIERDFELSLLDFHEWNPAIALPCDVLPVNQSFCIAASGPPWPQTIATTTALSTVTVTIPSGLRYSNSSKLRPTSTASTVTRSITTTSTVHATSTITERVSIPVTMTASMITTRFVEIPPLLTTKIVTSPVNVTITALKPFHITSYITKLVTIRTTVRVTSSVVVPTAMPTTIFATVPVRTRITTTRLITTTVVSTYRVLSVRDTTEIVQKTVMVPASPSVGPNGIATPAPSQPQMVRNCQTFYYVRYGDTCDSIGARHRVSAQQIINWNPYARADCTLLLADAFACVGVL